MHSSRKHTHTHPSCSSLDASYMQIAKWCSFFDVAQSRILDVFYITAEREGRKSRRGLPSKLPPFPFVCLHFYLFKSVSSNWKPACFFLSLPQTLSIFHFLCFPTLHPLVLFFSLLNPRRLRCWSLSQRKCRSSVFCDSPHTNTEEEMEMITSFSALSISPPLFHSPP